MNRIKLDIWLSREQHKWLLDTARRTGLSSRTVLECAMELLKEKKDKFILDWSTDQDFKADVQRKLDQEKRITNE